MGVIKPGQLRKLSTGTGLEFSRIHRKTGEVIILEEELLLKEKLQELAQKSDKNIGDVLIVGGGISGIQASLDLASVGYKVYMVEKSPSIGGHMAQLDKTFPTNDCSM